jgi:hypothetical protein
LLIIKTESKVGKHDEKYPKKTQQARQEGESAISEKKYSE